MSILQAPSKRQLDVGLAVLRVVVGAIFLAHGGQKLFVWGFAGVAQGFGGMGIPLASVTGPAVGLVEFFGGLALVVGLLTRLASLGLAVVMAGAIVLVHLRAGFFLPNGSEFALALLGGNLALVLMGAGGYSVDALLARRRGAEATSAPAGSSSGARRVA